MRNRPLLICLIPALLCAAACSSGSSAPMEGEPLADPTVDCGRPDPGECPPPWCTFPSLCEGGCTLSRDYWKEHSEDWPIDTVTMGGVVYSKEGLRVLLTLPSEGDASLILLHQYIPAVLSIAAGADSSELAGVLEEAFAWLDAQAVLPAGVSPSTTEGNAAVQLADALADFNDGAVGPGRCAPEYSETTE